MKVNAGVWQAFSENICQQKPDLATNLVRLYTFAIHVQQFTMILVYGNAVDDFAITTSTIKELWYLEDPQVF